MFGYQRICTPWTNRRRGIWPLEPLRNVISGKWENSFHRQQLGASTWNINSYDFSSQSRGLNVLKVRRWSSFHQSRWYVYRTNQQQYQIFRVFAKIIRFSSDELPCLSKSRVNFGLRKMSLKKSSSHYIKSHWNRSICQYQRKKLAAYHEPILLRNLNKKWFNYL